MDHIFKVVDASLVDTEIDQYVLDRLKRKEFGRMSGISVLSRIEKFEKSLLVISTRIQYIGMENEMPLPGVTGYYLTIMEFIQSNFFETADTDKKFEVLRKCFHLSEAHAYAMMCQQALEYSLSVPLMEPTPDQKLKDWSNQFLIG
ncbi:hypothetical protein GCM10007423_63910 [Dyadobacter endophyticus]|uniref:Uncharacterized protein n=1 Tax=Dyadobacter endophyticus TaxID=1749036 RepID=A0ABQ1ZAW7_9BACT|nr:hypothetical protein [Dyadobacter endophyticus]GGH55891.1 hypothetical protein GCM10007423_63910 [Dyadobacter endophyticus]